MVTRPDRYAPDFLPELFEGCVQLTRDLPNLTKDAIKLLACGIETDSDSEQRVILHSYLPNLVVCKLVTVSSLRLHAWPRPDEVNT